jgi:hypothetical protein
MPLIAQQADAVIVSRMAERAREDAEWLWVMLCAGCTEQECRAAMKGDPN